MSAEEMSRVNRMLVMFSRVACAVAIAVGSAVLVGWVLDIPVLKSLNPGWVSMKANAAICFLFAGLSLWFHLSSQGEKKYRMPANVFAVLVTSIGLFTLAEYVFKLNVSIDQLLFAEPPGTVGTFLPGRMALNSATGFSLLGLALLTVDFKDWREIALSQVLALVACLMGLVALIAYAFGLEEFLGYSMYLRMALHTSAAFIILSLGVLFARPARGGMAVITSAGIGGYTARRIMPVMILIPLLISWATSECERLGFYGARFGDVINATAYIAVAVCLAWIMARHLNRMDVERKRAEEERQRLTTVIENNTDFMGIASLDGQIVYLNPAAQKLVGLEASQVKTKTIFDFFSPDDLRAVQEQMLPAVNQTGHWTGECQFRHFQTGRAIPIELSGFVIPDAVTGKPIALATVSRDITERKRIEEVLRESEERFRSVVESANDAIVTMNEDGTITSWNRAAEKIFGYLTESALGLAVSTMMPERYREAHKAGMKRFASTGKSSVVGKTVELIGLRKDGSEFPLELSLAEMKVGSSRLFTAAIRDIAERKQAEDALRTSELQFRLLWQTSGDGMRLTDGNGTIVAVNDAFCRIVGQRKEELEGKLLCDVYEESQREHIRDQHRERFASLTVEPFLERKMTLWNGQVKWVEVSNSFFGVGGGKRLLLAVFRDITERKRAQELLRASEEQHRTLVQNLAEGVGVVDEEERFTFANPAAENIFGVPPGTLVGRTLKEFVEPHEYANIRKQTALRRSGETAAYEIQILRADYARKHILTTVSPLLSPDHGHLGSIGIFRDITDRKLAELERERLVEEMKVALENVNTLDGLLPICAGCKKIRDGEGSWNQLEKYLTEHTDVKLTHGLCPDCTKTYFPSTVSA